MPNDDIELHVLKNGWRLDALDEWRDDIERRLTTAETNLAELVNTKRIADAVAERVNKDRRLALTVMQKAAIGVFAVGWPIASAVILKFIG